MAKCITPLRTRIFRWSAPALLLPLAGCDWVVMNPSGDIAVQQRDLILISTALMLLVIVPVMVLTVLFAWRYRAANKAAEKDYDPDWDHSTKLELVIWSVPLLIIIVLGALTWVSTHRLDPYRPLDRIDAQTKVDPNTKPFRVEVVAMDWKWLFIYPDLGIATVNELAAPVNTPIEFKLTASTVMNSFYVPALAGQIYAMPAMQTKLHAVANKTGDFAGFSANYSGAGFSHMRFRFHSLDAAGFDKWVSDVKAGKSALDRPTYVVLEKPSEKVPVQRYANVDPTLFDAIVNLCARPGQRCMKDVMHVDAMGGGGKDAIHDIDGLSYDTPAGHKLDHAEHGAAPEKAQGDQAAAPAPDHSSHAGAHAPAQHR